MPEVILPCPNPKCGSKFVMTDTSPSGADIVKCCTCFMHGPYSDTEESAITAWNNLPRALTWTHEPPKVAGDCYVRTRPDESEQWNKPFVVFFSDGYLKDLKPTPLMQFAGPIAPPVEG